MEKSKVTRQNTYLNKEYFKIISVAVNKDKSEEFAQWFTGSSNSNRGIYSCPYLKTQIIVFYRYPSKLDHQATTVAVESLVVYLENEDEFAEIADTLQRYGQVPIKVIVSQFDSTELADKIGWTWIKKPEEPKELKDALNKLDMKEFKKIKKAFETYDSDGSGSIDNEELKKIAVAMGEDAESEDFKNSVHALDLNHDGTISFQEFLSWWKIGRQNTKALPKIYDLYNYSREHIKQFIDFENFVKDINEIDSNSENKISEQKLIFRSPGIFKLKTFIEFQMAIGGDKRTEMACDFLRQFTTNTGSQKTNWISILIPLNRKQKKIDVNKAKFLLEEFKENCLKWAEESSNEAFYSFIKNLVVFESSASEKAVILAIRMKLDIEELVKSAVQHFLYICSNLQPKKESTWLRFKAHSNLDLYDSLKRNISLREFFEVSELVLDGSCFRDRYKSLFLNMSKDYQSSLSILQFFFQPYNVDVELECNLSEVSDKSVKEYLDISLDKFKFLLDFLKKNISKELLSAADNFEIGINLFDVFAKFKVYTESTFAAQNIQDEI